MDNEKQKQEVIDFLENTYTGAKMMGDEEVMLRASRALLAFKADKYSYDITLSTPYGGTHGSLLEKDLCKEDTRVYRAGITVL